MTVSRAPRCRHPATPARTSHDQPHPARHRVPEACGRPDPITPCPGKGTGTPHPAAPPPTPATLGTPHRHPGPAMQCTLCHGAAGGRCEAGSEIAKQAKPNLIAKQGGPHLNDCLAGPHLNNWSCRTLRINDWSCRTLRVNDWSCRTLLVNDWSCRTLLINDWSCRTHY